MRRKFTFLVMLLTLLCGVNLNVLNAQEPITIGTGTDYSEYRVPICDYSYYSISQQIYTESEINKTGTIEKIAFHLKQAAGKSTDVVIYMTSTTKESYADGYGWVPVSDADIVYQGSINTSGLNAGDWLNIELQKEFDYNGGSIAITFNCYTSDAYGALSYFYIHQTDALKCLFKNGSNSYDCSSFPYGSNLMAGGKTAVPNVAFTFAVEDGLEPATPTNLSVADVKYNSISLTWNAAENAKKYNIYKGGEKIGSTSETSFTVDGLDAETAYSFTVTSVRGSKESDHSNVSTATTLAAPAMRDIVFTLKDSYGDGWNGGTLSVSATDGTSETLKFTSGKQIIYTLNIESGATVTVTFNAGSYAYEASYDINYDSQDGDLIISSATNGLVNSSTTFTFTVESIEPSVNVTPETIDFGIVRLGEYWSEREDASVDVVVEAINGAEIGTITTTNDFFTFGEAYPGENIVEFTVGYNKNGAAGNQTGNLVITYDETSKEIPMSATAYEAAEGDAIENPFEVTFDENGSYTYTITSLDGFYDDYIFSENEQYDANCPDVVFELTIAEGEKALVGATNANCWISRYDGFTPENGPASKHDYPETEVLSAGTYYFVLAPNSWALPFDFTITKTTVPAPDVSYSNPSDGVVNQDNPMLVWSMNYADEYQVLLGTTNPPTDVVVDWTSELATSYQTENLQNNTQYFWQVNARNEAGTTNGEVYSFVTLLDVPAITSATAVNLYPGEATTITWEAVENVSEYKVYNGYELLATLEPTVTSYELSGLDYNMTGYEITVTATQEGLGESLKSNAIIVKVAGEFPLVVSVKDANDNHIEGATVTINISNAFDQFQQTIEDVEIKTTNADGNATITLPLLSGNFYDETYGGYRYPSYTVNISKSPYIADSQYIGYSALSNNTEYEVEKTLNLPAVSEVFYEDLVIIVDSELVLTWDVVEGATAYKVYKNENLVETVTINEYTTKAEYDNAGSRYAVSAVFEGELESDKTYTDYIKVLGNGLFYGYVTDGTSPISGLTVELSGTNAIGEDVVTLITDESGYFEGEILEGNDYTLSISHYDYEEVDMSGIVIDYSTPNDLGIIVLTAKPSAEGIAVTATDNGEYANVTWTGSYEKYNVYRRNIENLKEVELLGEATTAEYADNEWAELEDGTYQYGVSAFIEEQAQSRGGEVIFEEGFENNGYNIPANWTRWVQGGTNWAVGKSGANSSPASGNYFAYSNGKTYGAKAYLETYEITMPANAIMNFKYLTPEYYGDINTLVINVLVEGNTSEKFNSNGVDYPTWENGYIDLSEFAGKTIKLQFVNQDNWGAGVGIDDIVITTQSSAVESQIVWSNELTKQGGPATFVGGYSENPTAWNVADNWSTGNVPDAGADVIINANAVISSEVNVASLTINGTYNDINLTIAAEGTLTVTGAINQTNYQLILEEGGQIFQNNADVTARFRMSIDNPEKWSNTDNKDGWQFISMPLTGVEYISFATNYNPSTGQSTCDYDLYKYDGSQDKEWQNYKDGGFYYGTDPETTFKSGTGYLASRKEVETVTVSGTLNTDIPYAFQNYAQSFYNEEKELANFRLFGNPFTYDIYLSDFTAQNIVNGYAVVGKDGNYVYRTTEPIKVGEGFFIQATGWTQFIYKPDSKGAKRESYNSLNVIASGKAGNDNLVINLGGYSEGFTKLQNFNENISEVFVANNGKRYGIANVDENTTEVELFFDAKEMGNYSISIEPNGKFQSVTLVDRMTGIETNMLMEDYNFTATANDNPNRFVIRLANGQEPTANDNFVYQSGEELIVNAEGTIQIIDVMGRMVYSNDVESSNNRINVSNLKGATYIVRNISDNTVRTQKVVIL